MSWKSLWKSLWNSKKVERAVKADFNEQEKPKYSVSLLDLSCRVVYRTLTVDREHSVLGMTCHSVGAVVSDFDSLHSIISDNPH